MTVKTLMSGSGEKIELVPAGPMGSRRRRRRFPTGPLLVIGGLLFVVGIYLLSRGETPRPKQQSVQQITLVQPPPPPPPPEEEKVLPKEVLKPTEKPQVQQDVEEVQDKPTPAPPTNQLAGLNRAADIGADSFQLAAGKGGGLFGRSSGGGGSWDQFVATHIRRALQNDPRTRSASGYLEVLLSISTEGRFERAELQSSTGDPDMDAAIRDVLGKMQPLSRGRPAHVKALTLTSINLRASSG